MKSKILVGRAEKVSFPQLGLLNLDARIDTGANTTALHYYQLRELLIDGESLLEVDFLSDNNEVSTYQFRSFTKRKIKSSNGTFQKRFVITTQVQLAGKSLNSEISLAKREKMAFPVLVGRKVLEKGFLVDVSKKYICSGNLE